LLRDRLQFTVSLVEWIAGQAPDVLQALLESRTLRADLCRVVDERQELGPFGGESFDEHAEDANPWLALFSHPARHGVWNAKRKSQMFRTSWKK
jgi:hypothetical protein